MDTKDLRHSSWERYRNKSWKRYRNRSWNEFRMTRWVANLTVLTQFRHSEFCAQRPKREQDNSIPVNDVEIATIGQGPLELSHPKAAAGSELQVGDFFGYFFRHWKTVSRTLLTKNGHHTLCQDKRCILIFLRRNAEHGDEIISHYSFLIQDLPSARSAK